MSPPLSRLPGHARRAVTLAGLQGSWGREWVPLASPAMASSVDTFLFLFANLCLWNQRYYRGWFCFQGAVFFCGQISFNLKRGWVRGSVTPSRHSLQVGAVPPGTAAFAPTEGVGEQSAKIIHTERKRMTANVVNVIVSSYLSRCLEALFKKTWIRFKCDYKPNKNMDLKGIKAKSMMWLCCQLRLCRSQETLSLVIGKTLAAE